MSKPFKARSETVTLGTDYAGMINVTDRGFETFGPLDQYVATFPTIQAARKALYELHRDSQEGLHTGNVTSMDPASVTADVASEQERS